MMEWQVDFVKPYSLDINYHKRHFPYASNSAITKSKLGVDTACSKQLC